MSSSIKCLECGLVNFATAASCKKCGTGIIAPVVSVNDAGSTSDSITVSADGSCEFVPVKREIGGWLTAFAIGIFIVILGAAYAAYTDFLELIKVEQWALTSGQDSSFRQYYENALRFDFILILAMLCLYMILAVKFIQKGPTFPRFATAVLSFKLLYHIINFFTLWGLEGEVNHALSVLKRSTPSSADFGKLYLETVVAGFVTLLWIGYFRTSKRVRETFLN